MRTARLLGVIGTILAIGFSGGLLLAPAAGAQPPFRLADYVTDNAGVLSDSGRAAVTSAVDKLYADRHVRLWVVYVDDFSGQSAVNWAQHTLRSSDLGDYDAAAGRRHQQPCIRLPGAVHRQERQRTPGRRLAAQQDRTRPAQRRLERRRRCRGQRAQHVAGSSGRVVLLVTLAVILVAVAILLLVMRYRGRRRRAAELAAARRVDPTDVNALAAVPLQALDDLSRSMVVEVDNAVRTSSNELDAGDRRVR